MMTLTIYKGKLMRVHENITEQQLRELVKNEQVIAMLLSNTILGGCYSVPWGATQYQLER